ncbi:MAG: hypothetical protein ACLU9S_17765 [Oscillospiraceae bacterium]
MYKSGQNCKRPHRGPREIKLIRDYVERQATGGMVLERTSTTRVTMLWRLSTYQK